ncbi:MAG: UDP-N-acetylmuramoyl-L-alanine--D-glutamate ligase, partial [Chthonomonadales bacterium]|nr:UDP-N-acetylmuramoyl-L-alanine--D-glutamate ligase [Chthonomonadales bacterium]
MMRTGQFAGKTIAVLGMGRTGLACSDTLQRLGARVILSDDADAERLGDRLQRAEELGVTVRPAASIEQALEGASLVVPSPGIRADAPILQAAVRAGIPVLSEIEIAYRIARAPILAVTGTNGKSTTAVWLTEMLKETGFRAVVAGNISADALKRTLIEAAEEMDEEGAIVAEVSSFQLEWVERFRPKIGILTNITRDHLDRHGSIEVYRACKARLFAAQRPDDFAILNAVNAPSRLIADSVRSRVVWFDRGHCGHPDWACVREGRIAVRLDGTEHILARTDELRLLGDMNVENALCASAAAIAFGADPDAVTEALRTFEGLPHRMELVAEVGGVAYINSSMTTNVAAAVRELEALKRPVILIAGGYDKGEDFQPLGAAIKRYVAHLVVMGRAASLLETAAWNADFNDVSRASDMADAVTQAARRARPGDAVMLAPVCASYDMYANFEERGQAFR